MKIVDIKPNTSEWHEFRRSHIGGSDCPIVMGKSPYKTPYQLWREKQFDEKSVTTDAMRRGSEMEAEARNWFNEKNSTSFEPAVGLNEDLPWQMVSLDGFSTKENMVLEIKCPGQTVLKEVEEKNIPEYWLWQIQHQLNVSGYEKAILLVYNPSKQIEMTVTRDEGMIGALNAQENVFYRKYMLEWEAPELENRDYEERTDAHWSFLVEERLEIQKELKALEAQEEENRRALIELANGKSCRGFGITVSKFYRKGNVDYSKIPELKGMDLNPYRKKGNEIWRIS